MLRVFVFTLALPFFLLAQLLEFPPAPPIAYRSPTERFTQYHGDDLIWQILETHGLTPEHRLFFEQVIVHEELGFFGYHSSSQEFRVFQDIIRMILEEICGISIREDFHFFRIPGKPQASYREVHAFLNHYTKVYDQLPEQQELLLSLNYTLFGNFRIEGSCSLYYFTKDYASRKVDFPYQLRWLFDVLGLPKDRIAELFSIGRPLSYEENAVLFQCFDFSHHEPFQQPYTLVDSLGYPSYPGGSYHRSSKRLSQLYLDTFPSPFVNQLRLLMTNSQTLNPYSSFSIKRYDRNPPELVYIYQTQLREAIKNLSYNPLLVQAYRELLHQLWSEI